MAAAAGQEGVGAEEKKVVARRRRRGGLGRAALSCARFSETFPPPRLLPPVDTTRPRDAREAPLAPTEQRRRQRRRRRRRRLRFLNYNCDIL